MRIKTFSLLAASASLLALSACESVKTIDEHGQYWQRVSASSATYLRGPKAQQMLKQGIARCVSELKELERLGAVRDAIPADRHGRVLDPDELEAERIKEKQRLADWDAPERQGQLYAEHSDYHDFEGCMLEKGWERIKYVPYDVAGQAKDQYLESHINYKRPDSYYERNQTRDRDFQDLNN